MISNANWMVWFICLAGKTGEIKETIAFSENYKCQVFEQPFSVRIFA